MVRELMVSYRRVQLDSYRQIELPFASVLMAVIEALQSLPSWPGENKRAQFSSGRTGKGVSTAWIGFQGKIRL